MGMKVSNEVIDQYYKILSLCDMQQKEGYTPHIVDVQPFQRIFSIYYFTDIHETFDRLRHIVWCNSDHRLHDLIMTTNCH